jgi:hypothetical protein
MHIALRLRIRGSLPTPPLLHQDTDIVVGNGSHLSIHFFQMTFKNNVSHQKKNDIVGKGFDYLSLGIKEF